jgi:transcriptional regulator with XRE-family HTH domain
MTMTMTRPATPRAAAPNRVGELLRGWRQHRRLSQLDLANEAEISTRHLSCVETGRAKPSRAFVLHVAEHLDVPLRARNELLVAAGYAPVYSHTDLDAPEMASVREAIDLVLTHAEPFPAVVVDRHWNLVRANAGIGLMLHGVAEHLLEPPVNVLRVSMHPEGGAPLLEDFEAYSAQVLTNLRREAAALGDPVLMELHDELAGYPGVAAELPVTEPVGVVLPVRLRTPIGVLSFFTTIARFGTAADVTLAELSIESFFPADEATARAVREAAAAG